MATKALSAQRIVNAFPMWSETRMNEQSLGYQFANVIGNRMDDMLKQIQKIRDSYYIALANVADIDLYYYMRLPDTYEFTKDDDDTTEWIYTPPTASGLVDGTYFSVSAPTENTVENFWYLTPPSRISLGTTASGAYLMASGYAWQSPLSPVVVSGTIDVPNRLYVTVSGGSQYLYVDDYNITSRTIVQLDGEDRPGGELIEEMYYVYDEIQRSIHEFSQLDKVNIYTPNNNSDIFVTVQSASYNLPELPHAWRDMTQTSYRDDMELFWGIGQGDVDGQCTLELRKYNADDPTIRLGGFTATSAFQSYELLNTSSQRIQARDFAVEPHSDNIWVVDSGVLYLYDGNLYYPNMQGMTGRNYDAPSVIEPSSYWVVQNEEVKLYYTWKRPTSEITQYRIWVEKPDGNKYSIVGGVEGAYQTGAGSWNAASFMTNRRIQQPDTFTMDQRGDYVYALEVQYADETSSIDKRVISVLSKTPEAQFGLASAIGSHNEIIGIDIDSEQKLWVLDTLGYKYQVNLHYDVMIVDFDQKIVYFREPYEQVRVY